MKTRQELLEKIVEVLEENNISSDVDIVGVLSNFDGDTEFGFEDIVGHIEDNNAFDIDIIYYSNAINYLKENDPSLMGSTGIASEYGYNVNDLDSELLASLHASRKAREDFNFCENEINELIEEFEELNGC